MNGRFSLAVVFGSGSFAEPSQMTIGPEEAGEKGSRPSELPSPGMGREESL